MKFSGYIQLIRFRKNPVCDLFIDSSFVDSDGEAVEARSVCCLSVEWEDDVRPAGREREGCDGFGVRMMESRCKFDDKSVS